MQVIEKGHIAEFGTPYDLLKSKGKFYQMARQDDFQTLMAAAEEANSRVSQPELNDLPADEESIEAYNNQAYGSVDLSTVIETSAEDDSLEENTKF